MTAQTNGVNVKPLPSIPPYGNNAVEVNSLTFSYRDVNGSNSALNNDPNSKMNAHVLQDLNLSLATGSRCLLIGANGSGMSDALNLRVVMVGSLIYDFFSASSTLGIS